MLVGIAKAQYAGVIHSYFIDTLSNRFLNTTAITGSTNSFTYRYICLRLSKDIQGFANAQYSTSKIVNKFTSAYPFIGGNSTTCSYNFINPSIYQLTFYNNPSDTNGVTFNGTTQYANTGIYPNLLINDSTHLSIYMRTNTQNSGTLDFGIFQYAVGANSLFSLVTPRVTNSAFGIMNSQNSSTDYATTASASTRQGLWTCSRTNSAASSLNLFFNGASVATASTNSASYNLSNYTGSIYMGCINDINSFGVSTPSYYSAGCWGFGSIGQGFTPTEAQSEYNAIQAFNQRLGRSVGANIY